MHCHHTCLAYREAIVKGEDKESARDLLASGYRQGFSVSGNFKEWMHLLDRRLLADTQLESRIAAQMALDLLCEYSRFFVWYKDTRAGKNKLAP
jgi:thymidylate synthase ThyX